MKKSNLLLALLVGSSFVLTACGGGGTDVSKTGAAVAEPASGASAVLVPTLGPQSNHPDTPSSVTTSTSASITPTVADNTTAVAPQPTGLPPTGAASSASNKPISSQVSPTTTTQASIFYGVNGHANEGGAYDISSDDLKLQQLQDLGAKVYRNEVFSQAGATRVAALARTMAAGGITVTPVMLMDIDQASNETDGYNQGFTLGKQTASAYAFPYIEVTNEIESSALTGNVDGVNPDNFDNTKFQIARGIIRGMIDGVKSVNPNTKIIMGGGAWLHYGFYQMLAKGTQPDGTSGHDIPSWDITAWHWYSDQGDIENACGGTGCHDVLATLHQFGKPIWLNEFGVRPSYGNDTQVASYLAGNTMMAEFVRDASKYNIQAIQFYELYDDPAGGEGPYGLLRNDSKTQKPQYSAYKTFVASHPM